VDGVQYKHTKSIVATSLAVVKCGTPAFGLGTLAKVFETPAPRVYSWNSQARSHPVGAEFIIMDKIEAKTFLASQISVLARLGVDGVQYKHTKSIVATSLARVYSWNSQARSHPVGAEFIIMDKIEGVPLSQVWGLPNQCVSKARCGWSSI
jgi:hypothetical protein